MRIIFRLPVALAGLTLAATAHAASLSGPALDVHLRAVKRIEAEAMRDPDSRGVREAPGERAGNNEPAGERAVTGLLSVPGNIKYNDSSGDFASATQSETSIAAFGDLVLVAWNDGEGSATGGAYEGYAYSSDGGITFVDGGDPPRPAAFPAFRWRSDPVVTVNQKTGTFYYVAMATTDASHNAVAVARGAFAGGTFVWQDVQVVREGNNNNTLLDKPWIVADSSGTGLWVYVTFTTFTVSGDRIDLVRSSDGGVTWSNPFTLSSMADNGQVQASRPLVGPQGQLHVVWWAVGQGTTQDFIRVRTSLNHGQSFAAEVTAASQISNFGTGGPGFTRDRGIHWPSAAVDRTTGLHRGRIYLAWTESYDFQDDALGTGAARVEQEPNGSWLAGTPFTPGDVLRGTTGSVTPPDLDYWSVSLAEGQSLVVWADSLPAGQGYGLRVFPPGPDSTESLAFGGDLFAGGGDFQAYYTFTAPLTSTYALRMEPTDVASTVGGYRIRTGIGVRGAERGRDQRDVFVSFSDDGVSWSAPARVNDDKVGLDDFLAEVAVGADGCPYATWYDYREDSFGTQANVYAARSSDGGLTWSVNHKLTSLATRWQHTGSNLIPNMGDYHGLISDERWLRAAWADGRDGSADAYGARLDQRHTVTACAPDAVSPPGNVVTLSWTVRDDNPVFDDTYALALSGTRAWPVSGPATVAVAAGGEAEVSFQVTVPDTAAPGPNTLTFTATNAMGTVARGCSTQLTTTIPVAVGGGEAPRLALAPARPNPARDRVELGFSLPRAGHAALAIYALDGSRVAVLIDGTLAPGTHGAVWDGRTLARRFAPTGAYFVRLGFEGESATRRFVWLR